MVNFTDAIYKSDTEHFRTVAAPLTSAVDKRDNREVHKFFKYLTQGSYSWKWI